MAGPLSFDRWNGKGPGFLGWRETRETEERGMEREKEVLARK